MSPCVDSWVSSPPPRSRSPRAVGEDVLKDFVALTKIHGDGWGVARVRPRRRRPEGRGVGGQRAATTRTSPPRPMTSGRPRAWSTCAGRPPDSRSQPENSHPFVRRRTRHGTQRVHQADRARSTSCSNPRSPRPCAAPPTASATSALIRQHRALVTDLAEAVRRAVAQLRERLSRRQPQCADPRRGPADRRARTCPQSAARTRTSRRSPRPTCPPSTSRTTSRMRWRTDRRRTGW